MEKEVKTEGTLKEMVKATNLDEQTVAGALEVVEKAAGMEIDVPGQEAKDSQK